MFWNELHKTANLKTKLHSTNTPIKSSYIGTSKGLPSGLSWNYSVRGLDSQVGLYIDADQGTGMGNTIIFDKLKSRKTEIENEFGGPLEWESLEGKRACRISKAIPIAGWQNS